MDRAREITPGLSLNPQGDVMTDQPKEPSIKDLMDQARRAHEIVQAVDFEKLAAHDPDEAAKLKGVTEALDRLSNGEMVEHVEGVDEVVEVSTELEQRMRLMEVFTTAGLGDRLSQVRLHDGTASASRPLDLIPHREGLPAFDVCLAPDDAPAEGAHGIFVSGDTVFSAHVPEPVIRHHWHVLGSQPYEDDTTLVAIVQQYLNPSN